VEGEINGLLTYDRKVLKVSPEQQAGMKAKIQRTINSRLKNTTTVVPAGDEKSGIQWKYTTTEPSGQWFAIDFDATSWKTGQDIRPSMLNMTDLLQPRRQDFTLRRNCWRR
jgi:hypothetical protein